MNNKPVIFGTGNKGAMVGMVRYREIFLWLPRRWDLSTCQNPPHYYRYPERKKITLWWEKITLIERYSLLGRPYSYYGWEVVGWKRTGGWSPPFITLPVQ